MHKVYKRIEALHGNIGRVIKGKPEAITLAITTLLARGHLLIEDVPGVGKTILAQGLAMSINSSFQRIQFTSDLLPSDILGVPVYNPHKGTFEFKPGPIFANIVLVDEINRTSPKTQSSLLEAMNEFQISVDGQTYPLPQPFVVVATQNPLEYQGTYPLPESQLDRFMTRTRMGYPPLKEEKEILSHPRIEEEIKELQPVMSSEEVIEIQKMVDGIRVREEILNYLMGIVTASRNSDLLRLGVSPRGALFLLRAAKAKALMEGRDYCIPDDVKSLALAILAHRTIPASGYGIDSQREETENILLEILDQVPVPL
ncbi:MAG: MoxR family ATPase [Deltaproteobacteria bacterium]|nr:MoxR family ATPase [Deltaproteobacteria bacterium]